MDDVIDENLGLLLISGDVFKKVENGNRKREL